MPQIVNGDPGDADFVGETVEAIEHQMWLERAAVGLAEDEPGEWIRGVAAGVGSGWHPVAECGGDAG
ncbi:hypothetical protein [Streptomyces sp. NPDC058066]|uniref:hypothetical protein n=1 Tax=Streptomyces sp. NPDC058066 TaxID=3346323 RepID=UPI0036DFED16